MRRGGDGTHEDEVAGLQGVRVGVGASAAALEEAAADEAAVDVEPGERDRADGRHVEVEGRPVDCVQEGTAGTSGLGDRLTGPLGGDVLGPPLHVPSEVRK